MKTATTNNSINVIKQLASVFFTVNRQMKVSKPSPTLCKYLPDTDLCEPDIWQANFFDLFAVTRPHRLKDFSSIINARDSMALLVLCGGNFAMRGQFVTLDDDSEHVIFVGAPWLAWMSTNQPDTQLMMNEFKPWDPQLDQLMLLSTEKNNIADLKNLTGELREARDKAEKASQIQADFFAIMSHEMRTPLTGVVTALELIDNSELSPRNSEMLSIVKNSAENLKYVVDHVLDYSKLQAGGFENQPTDFDLKHILQSALMVVDARAREQASELSLLIEDNIAPWLRADAAKIRQVLINLLSNAVKVTENGQIKVTESLNEQQYLQVSVCDTGLGIPLDIQPNIFKPFLTFDAKQGEKDSGTGLGLNISRRLVELMGGTIDFESKPAQGAVFYFVIPVEVAKTPIIKPQLIQPVDQSFNGHVLLVEDNKTNQFLSRILLEGRGLTVDVAGDGRQAIDKISETHYDLVFMDVSMPVLDGVSATKILRETLSNTQLPIIALTAHVGDHYHKRFIDSGMDAVLSKPIDRILLDSHLSRWLPVQSLDNYTAPISPKEQLNIAKQDSDKDWFVQDTASILLDDIGISAFVQISNLFLAEIDEGVQQICSAYQQGDIELLADHAHTIRSSASSIGCQALGQHLAFIETAAQSNTTLALEPLVSMLPVIVKKSSDPLIIYLKAIVK